MSTGSATGESRYRCIKSASDVGYGNRSAGFLARPEFQSPGHKRLFQPTDPDEVEICRLNQPRRHIFEGTCGVGRGRFQVRSGDFVWIKGGAGKSVVDLF